MLSLRIISGGVLIIASIIGISVLMGVKSDACLPAGRSDE
jgi:hypothetical protein